ncbi:MAG TPA: class I SAM-dependent methyltransferase [Methylophilaceae bacterium]|jgi:methylase of polypeptide subunit release factors
MTRNNGSKPIDIRHRTLADLLRTVKETGYGFTTITPFSHAIVNARPGNQWAKMPEAAASQHSILQDIFGWSRAFHQSQLGPEIFDLMEKANVLEKFEDGWRSKVRISTMRHAKFGCHCFLHSAYPSSQENAVFFGPDTYRYLHEIDREVNVRTLHGHDIERAVDIGAGAGPGAILLALYYPQADVYAADINPDALELTAVNAEVAGVGNVIPLYSNLLADIAGQFDLITANPPYLIDDDKRTYRHGGDDDGADLSYAIVEASMPRLNQAGALLLYTGVAIKDGQDTFQKRVEQYLGALQKDIAWTYHEIDPDIFGEELLKPSYRATDRIAAVLLRLHRGMTIY